VKTEEKGRESKRTQEKKRK